MIISEGTQREQVNGKIGVAGWMKKFRTEVARSRTSADGQGNNFMTGEKTIGSIHIFGVFNNTEAI